MGEYMQNNINFDNLISSMQIKVIDDDIRFWLVRTQGGLFFDEFIDSSFIAIAWNFLDKKIISDDKSEKDIKKTVEKLENKYSNVMKQQGRISKGQGRRAYNKCDRFINELKEGDIVMIPSYQSSYVAFARVGKYYEIKEYDFDKEMDIMSDAYPGDILAHKCPYKKRRKIEVLKVIKSNNMNPNLFKALVSYHGLSRIDDFSEYILSSMYDIYYYNNKINCVFNVRQRKGLDAIDLSNFLYNFSSLLKIENNETKITAKLNLNSPGQTVIQVINDCSQGAVDFIYSYRWWILMGWMALTGGSLGPVKFEGFINYLLKYKESILDWEKFELEKEKFNFDKDKFYYEKRIENERISSHLNEINSSSKSLKIDESPMNNIIDLSIYFSQERKSNDDDIE